MIQSTRRIFFYGLLFMIPALIGFDFHPEWSQIMQPTVLANLLFLGLGASAACFVTWNFAVKHLGAVKTSVYIYMVPVVTVTTSVIVLHEKLTPLMAIGILLTLSGLVLSQRSSVREKQTLK